MNLRTFAFGGPKEDLIVLFGIRIRIPFIFGGNCSHHLFPFNFDQLVYVN